MVEHYFHMDAIYVFNATHDELRPIGHSLSQWWKTGTREKSAEAELLARMEQALSSGTNGVLAFRFAGARGILEARPEENFYSSMAPKLAGLLFGQKDKFALRYRPDAGSWAMREEHFDLECAAHPLVKTSTVLPRDG